mmetsp:Transcript_3377/g.7753  ORF Transcript_3377/g.7753 Transcript_3377/m.7753 type:complete len:378 (-) Transcript_3377:81-1214(-)
MVVTAAFPLGPSGRLARLAGHCSPALSPAPQAQQVPTSPGACPRVTGSRPLGPAAAAASETDERPVVLLLEAPAEDAVPPNLVEDAFATHDLRILWDGKESSTVPASSVRALVTVKRKVDAAVLDRFPSLRLVAVAFTGYDHVDLQECKKRGVAVANVPGYSTDGVAELCFGLMFSLLRHIPIAHQHVRAGKWAWPPGNELAGKRLGVIGTGQIGIRVSEIGKAFKVSKVLGFDQIKNPKFEQLGGEYVGSLATLFLHADVLVVAVALTNETRGLVSAKLLKLLRPDSIFINCARGAIVDQEALTKMLGEGRFRAGLDVYEVEPLPVEHPLRSIPESHLVTVPHLAYKCEESLRRRQDITLANILAFLADSPQNIVS